MAVIGDWVDEADETFVVNLSGAAQAQIADGQGLGTILDDDFTLTVIVGSTAVQSRLSEAVDGWVDVYFEVPAGSTEKLAGYNAFLDAVAGGSGCSLRGRPRRPVPCSGSDAGSHRHAGRSVECV